MDKIFKNKKYVIYGVISLIVIILIILLIVFFGREKKVVFNLDPIYDVYPEEVQALYVNMVEVSCYGDWFLNIGVNNGVKISVNEIDKKLLLDYAFNYMKKNSLLRDSIKLDKFNKYVDKLFYGDFNFNDLLKDYSYSGYKYYIKKKYIVREDGKCDSDKKYVSKLSGYYDDGKTLYLDVDIGYMNDGFLYDINNKQLGKYDGNLSRIDNLFLNSPYYRFRYVLKDGNYLLEGVEVNIKY